MRIYSNSEREKRLPSEKRVFFNEDRKAIRKQADNPSMRAVIP